MKNDLISSNLRGFRSQMFMGCVLIIAIFFHLPPTSSHLHPLQVENCDSNSRLVVDEDYNGKFRFERVNVHVLYFLVVKV